MSFKLPNRPSPQPGVHELADFMELIVLINGRCSATEIQRFLGRIDDNDLNIGIEDNDLKNEVISDGMMTEIGYRVAACPDGYPFCTDETGSVLYLRDDCEPTKALLYKYLLLATRFRMSEHKRQGGVDGALLMEEVGAAVLGSYLGARARTTVFGTARQGSFAEKVSLLCRSLMEGGCFKTCDTGAVNANDDGLDIVGWIPFVDKLPAKLCIFAQCKAGTTWRDGLSRLDPPGFIKRWMSGIFAVDPIKAYFIAESADRSQWNGACIYGGILFDRCRIVDLAESFESELVDHIKKWTDAAFQTLSGWDWS